MKYKLAPDDMAKKLVNSMYVNIDQQDDSSEQIFEKAKHCARSASVIFTGISQEMGRTDEAAYWATVRMTINELEEESIA